MALHYDFNPLARFLLYQINLSQLSSVEAISVNQARYCYEQFSKIQGGFPPVMVKIENHRVPNKIENKHQIPIRIYRPTLQPRPLLLYFHGGGWMIGSINSHDSLCRHLAKAANCIVISVEYSLAPEYPFPKALHEVSCVYEWCQQYANELNSDASMIAIGGDSAGGNLAAVLSAELVEKGYPLPKFQLLLYPTLDMTLQQRSMSEFEQGFFLTKKTLAYYTANYVQNHDVTDWRISPIYYPNKEKLPPSIILTANCDPVRDDGQLFVTALIQAGIKIAYKNISRTFHGFLQMPITFPNEVTESFVWLGNKMKDFWSVRD